MSKKRILYITQEMNPYTRLGELSKLMKSLPKKAQQDGYEIRVLMPRFGTINERKHKLHEVVRLSGMNIIVDEEDFPLIIKVASYPGARMQVYFLDNEEFFSQKYIFVDKKEKPVEENVERMVFFCKGVVETVKKFGWAPDIISCHGWFTSLIPTYLKTVYKKEPIFSESKIIFNTSENDFVGELDDSFYRIAAINDLEKGDLNHFDADGNVVLAKGAIEHSDLVIQGSENSEVELSKLVGDKPLKEFKEGEEALEQHLSSYKEILPEE